MINNDQSTLLLYCCEDVKSHRSGGDTVPLRSRVVAKTSARGGGGERCCGLVSCYFTISQPAIA